MKQAVKGQNNKESVAHTLPLSGRIGGLAIWVVVTIVSFYGSQAIVYGFVYTLIMLGVSIQVDSIVTQLLYRLAVYAVMVAIICGVIWYRHRKVTLAEVGLSRLLQWGDIGLSMAGFIVYALAATGALTLAATIPSFNASQVQELGLSNLYGTDMLVAFIVLVVLTPLFEEAIFRGFLYGRIRGLKFPWWLSAVVVSILFGAAHMQWNVAVDVFCLSMVACAMREITGSIWSGVLLHMAKNFIAFLVIAGVISGVVGA